MDIERLKKLQQEFGDIWWMLDDAIAEFKKGIPLDEKNYGNKQMNTDGYIIPSETLILRVSTISDYMTHSFITFCKKDDIEKAAMHIIKTYFKHPVYELGEFITTEKYGDNLRIIVHYEYAKRYFVAKFMPFYDRDGDVIVIELD